MCGPPDFGALNTCLIRLAELSAAGLATYSVCKAASLARKLRAEHDAEKKGPAQDTSTEPATGACCEQLGA
jgi:hypothetical protein